MAAEARAPRPPVGLRRAPSSRRLVSTVVLATALAACAHRALPPRPATSAEVASLRAALAAREHAIRGLRVSMRVRISAGERPSLLSSPAYLAVDAAGAIRLQVLSPFGMTVFDLAIAGDEYVLTLPLANETKRGRVDLAALTAPDVGAGDRMIVALALLFTPKSASQCDVETTRTVSCPVEDGVVAHLEMDADRRPVRERYTAGGRALFTAAYADYATADAIVPGRLQITDDASGTRMTARITRARTARGASR